MTLCFFIDPDDSIPFEVDPLVEDPLWFHSQCCFCAPFVLLVMHFLAIVSDSAASVELMDFGIVSMKKSVVPEFLKDVRYETQHRSSKTPD